MYLFHQIIKFESVSDFKMPDLLLILVYKSRKLSVVFLKILLKLIANKN